MVPWEVVACRVFHRQGTMVEVVDLVGDRSRDTGAGEAVVRLQEADLVEEGGYREVDRGKMWSSIGGHLVGDVVAGRVAAIEYEDSIGG